MDGANSLLLHHTIICDNVKAMRRLLAKGVDVNASTNKLISTPLHMAASYNSEKILKLLLESGAKVDTKNSLGLTALDLNLIGSINSDVIKTLIDFGDDVNGTCSLGGTVLHQVAKRNKVELVEYLISKGADVNLNIGMDQTALHQAATHNLGNSHRFTIEALLKNGAYVNARDNRTKKTTLHYLVKKGDVETVQLLIDYQADVHAEDSKGQTPLFDAVFGCNNEVVQMLINIGLYVNSVNSHESTLLQEACSHGVSKGMIRTLLKNGADIHRVKYERLGSLTAAKNSMRILLEHCDASSIGTYILNNCPMKRGAGVYLEHIAMLRTLEITVHPDIIGIIERCEILNKYFKACVDELELAKKTKLRNSWVTFFDLLVAEKTKLKNYAGNEDLMEDFESTDSTERFSVYGALMEQNVARGVERRKLYNRASVLWSYYSPIFNPDHLIIRDTLNYLSTKNLSKLCEEN